MSKIEWTNETWNPIAGCSIVSTECKNCYAMRQAHRLAKMGQEGKYGGLTEVVNGHIVWNGEVRFSEDDLDRPLRVKKPRMFFVNSMSDLFHEKVKDEWIAKTLGVIAACPQHTFQILTKRSDRMMEFFNYLGTDSDRAAKKICELACDGEGYDGFSEEFDCLIHNAINGVCGDGFNVGWPMRNLWLGTSVGHKLGKYRIDHLRRTLAAVRFLSCEPLLEDLATLDLSGIHWVIPGGESGTGARECRLEWIRNIIGQCREQHVKLFVKQLGAAAFSIADKLIGIKGVDGRAVPTFRKLKHGKGGDISEFPPDLRIREFPEVPA